MPSIQQKRVCQKFMTHPLFFISSKIFLLRIFIGDFYSSEDAEFIRRHSCYRITHGFSRIFGRWPMAGARNVLILFCHADFADDANFSSWEFFVPQISQIFTDFYGISGESLCLHRITRSYRNILALRITHGFSRIFGRWPMAGARNVLILFCHADFADDANFSSWEFFVPQISQIFTDFYGISGESLSPLSGGIRNDRTGRLCENP